MNDEGTIVLEGDSLTFDNIARECRDKKRYAIVSTIWGSELCVYFFVAGCGLFCETSSAGVPVTEKWLKTFKKIEFPPIL